MTKGEAIEEFHGYISGRERCVEYIGFELVFSAIDRIQILERREDFCKILHVDGMNMTFPINALHFEDGVSIE